MKKTLITLLLAAAGISAGAQTMYDALLFSENNYEGTARTVAMGNAFTALGGDLGSITINPAGSAVAKYSQFTISPGISISSNTAQGTSNAYFSRSLKSTDTKFTMPNIGFNINFDTHRTTGLKNWSLGFVVNRTNSFHNNVYASGLNSTTSFAGSMATLAQGFSRDDLTLTNTYDPYYDSTIPFDVILAFESGIIDNIVTQNSAGDQLQYDYDYVGVSENYLFDSDGNVDFSSIRPGGILDQTYSRETTGSKSDYVINFGANLNDVVYFGANLGFTSINYNQEWFIREQTGGLADDYSQFQTQLNYLRYSHNYQASGVGIYGKFGVIVVPGGGFRIGAAIQTPTSTSISEEWISRAEMNTYGSYGSGSAETPLGEYSYKLTSPFRYNFGLAYTFGNVGVISLDYEGVNYSSMRFHDFGTFDNSAFDATNSEIMEMMGASHNIRAGIEVKPLSSLAVRLGYGLTTSPEHYYDLTGNLEKAKANINRFSAGLGYSTSGSFFLDMAVQATKYANEYIYPYDYYYVSGNNVYVDDQVDTPEILSSRWLWNVVLTFGWRF